MKKNWFMFFAFGLMATLLLFSCKKSNPTSPEASVTPATSTFTCTVTDSVTPADTFTATITETVTQTNTETPTFTATFTFTSTPTATATPLAWYIDSDSDGYGHWSGKFYAYEQPAGYVSNMYDCNDQNVSIHPDAPEYCNEIDEDCDGMYNEDAVDPLTWYRDSDGDGYGDPLVTSQACYKPAGYVSNSDDDDDTVYSSTPLLTWYRDNDGDGYGYNGDAIISVAQPMGYVLNGGDCNEANTQINPGAPELCSNSIDDDCDGMYDEGGCVIP